MYNEEEVNQKRSNWGLLLLVVVLAGVTFFSLVYLARERRHVRELSASRDELNAALDQTRSQMEALSAKFDALSAAAESSRAKSASLPSGAKTRRRAGASSPAGARSPEDPRWKQVQTQLSEHNKQIASTREEVEKAREDLQGKLNSTRDELGGSIARTHEDLVALQKRGERNYYEFHLTKSKQFQRVGPISLSLRKANVKRKSYDLAMMVDDLQLQKKGVNVYESVWINLTDRPQPLELVINRISKDQVQGYVSEPKYKKSELAATASAGSKSQIAEPGPGRLREAR